MKGKKGSTVPIKKLDKRYGNAESDLREIDVQLLSDDTIILQENPTAFGLYLTEDWLVYLALLGSEFLKISSIVAIVHDQYLLPKGPSRINRYQDRLVVMSDTGDMLHINGFNAEKVQAIVNLVVVKNSSIFTEKVEVLDNGESVEVFSQKEKAIEEYKNRVARKR